jgi:hypothetical protein
MHVPWQPNRHKASQSEEWRWICLLAVASQGRVVSVLDLGLKVELQDTGELEREVDVEDYQGEDQ